MVKAVTALFKNFVTHMLGAAGSFLGAAILGLVLVLIIMFVSPPKLAGDRIMQEAKDHFSGRVTSVDEGSTCVRLTVATERGDREVVLAEIGLFPALSPALAAQRVKSLARVAKLVLGQQVEVYSPHVEGVGGLPAIGHVVFRGNFWLNGGLVEEGFCYTVTMERPLRMAVDELSDLESKARARKVGAWPFITREQFLKLYRHS